MRANKRVTTGAQMSCGGSGVPDTGWIRQQPLCTASTRRCLPTEAKIQNELRDLAISQRLNDLGRCPGGGFKLYNSEFRISIEWLFAGEGCRKPNDDESVTLVRRTDFSDSNTLEYHRCAECLHFMAKIHAISLGVGTRHCPLCGSEDVLRSHRRGLLEWTILLPLLLRPFRCRQCSARHLGFFFRQRRVKEADSVVVK